MNTPDNTQGGEHGDDTKSTEHTAPTEDDAPQPQRQINELSKQAHKRKKAREDAKALHTNIMRDYNNLKQEVLRHGPYYFTAEDHVIANGMKERAPWKEQMSNISKDLKHLKFLIHINTIEATQTLSDRTIEIDPDKAIAWYLGFETTIHSTLRLGDRTTSLGRE